MARDRITKRTCQVSKIINAPLKFVSDWCTDYREDDLNIIASKSRIRILEKTKHIVVYTIRYRAGVMCRPYYKPSSQPWKVGELLLGALSFRTVEFQVTAFHTHEDLYCKTGSDVNATIASESWYGMIGLYLVHRAITFGTEFDLGILIFAAQTRHV